MSNNNMWKVQNMTTKKATLKTFKQNVQEIFIFIKFYNGSNKYHTEKERETVFRFILLCFLESNHLNDQLTITKRNETIRLEVNSASKQ